VSKYKDAQEQAQGQAVFNEQKLTNLALMLETEYLNRQNMVVDSVTKKLNYQVRKSKKWRELILNFQGGRPERAWGPGIATHDQLDRRQSQPRHLELGPGRDDQCLRRQP